MRHVSDVRYATTRDGATIAFQTTGHGPPVLYATGMPTQVSALWDLPVLSYSYYVERMARFSTLIAFDTATERMTIALRRGERVVAHEGEGGARASATLLPAILGLLGEAGIAVADLDAIAFGRGPGAFTGLRTACSVAQGLAFGAGKRVLPIDSLLAVAEDARGDATTLRVWALIDARMDQIYAAEYEYDGERWTVRVAPFLTDCEALASRWRDETCRRARTRSSRSSEAGTDAAGATRGSRSRIRRRRIWLSAALALVRAAHAAP